MKSTIFCLLLFIVQLFSFGLNAAEQTEEKTWWEKRRDRPDIFYPHEIHKDIMEKKGDSCMLCHSFLGNKEHDSKRLKSLTTISNEPLKSICHDCHVVKLEAPWRCDVCHSDPKSVWPDSHNFNYVENHSEDARHDEHACRECHIDVSFCTDCHFRRDPAQRRVHSLGYRNYHGIEARMDPAGCASCHDGAYCEDCHRGRR